MYLSVCFELIEAIFCGITITSFSHPTGFIVCSVHPNGHFCSDWQDMLCANCKTPAWYTVSPASVILVPQAETSAWEGVERMHSSSQVSSLAGEALTCLVYWDLVRGWAPQASLWDQSVPKAATLPPAWCPQTQYPWPQPRPTLWGESGGSSLTCGMRKWFWVNRSALENLVWPASLLQALTSSAVMLVFWSVSASGL